MFCKVSGAMLTGHDLSTNTGTTLKQCLSLCTSDSYCYSLNYVISTAECTLNNVTDLGNGVRFNTSLSHDFLYYTTRECSP